MNDSQSIQPDPSSLPDLPGLEELKPQLAERTALVAGYLGFILVPVVLITWSYLRYRTYLDGDQMVRITSLMAVMSFCVIWIVGRILFSYSTYGISREGFLAYALLRKRVIPWEEILDVSRKDDANWGDRITLTTTTGFFRFKISDTASKLHGCLLTASIWQHMRKRGRVFNEILNDEEFGLWEAIPETVPHTVESKYSGAIASVIVALMIFVGILYFQISSITEGHAIGGLVLSFCMLSLMLPVYFLFIAHKPRHISVTDSEIVAEKVFEKVTIYWYEVTAYGANKEQFWIKADNPKRVIWLPLNTNTPEANDLRLAVVRNLRTTRAVPHPSTFVAANADWKKLQKKKVQSASVARAYIASQPVEIQSNLKRISNLAVAPIFSGIFGAMLCMLNPFGYLYAAIRFSSSTLYYYSEAQLACALTMMIPIGVLVHALLSPVIKRIAYSCPVQSSELLHIHGYPVSKRDRWIFGILTAISLAATVLVTDTYVRIESNQIYDNPFLSISEKRHSYSDITSIQQKPSRDSGNHQKVSYSTYILSFRDGEKISLSEQILRGQRRKKLTTTIQYISQKTKVPITYSE